MRSAVALQGRANRVEGTIYHTTYLLLRVSLSLGRSWTIACGRLLLLLALQELLLLLLSCIRCRVLLSSSLLLILIRSHSIAQVERRETSSGQVEARGRARAWPNSLHSACYHKSA